LGAVGGDVGAGFGDHVGGHVDADDAAGCADFGAGDEAIEAATGTEIEDDFAGLEGGDGGGVAAGEAHVCFGGRSGEIGSGVADCGGELFGGEGCGAAAATGG